MVILNGYSDFPHYLEQLGENKIRPGLERVRDACSRLHHPERRFKSVHVVGTNGKGSTAAFLESVIRNNGYKVGLYTSPHLVDVKERIQIDRHWISSDHIVFFASRIVKECADIELSYFEFLTLIAFLWFAEQDIDIAVVETGLGGRWDATNVLIPLLVVMTPISIDHTSYLGSDIVSIVHEKCGVIKQGVPLVTSMQAPDVMKVIKSECDKVGAPLILLKNVYTDVKPSLSGGHQIANASLALRSAGELNKFGYKIDWKNEYLEVDWPGRMQKISTDPDIIIDGAHNPHACNCLVDHIEKVYGERDVVIIFGAMMDKDIGGMVSILKRIASGWVVFPLGGVRAAKEADLRDAIGNSEIEVAGSVDEAIDKTRGFGYTNPLIVVTGSLYLTGKFLSSMSYG